MKTMRAILAALLLLALLAMPGLAQDGGNLLQIDLDEQNNSGISGTATLETQEDGTTRVDLVLEGVDEEGEYPAHIHAGQCPEPGDITYPLEPVVFNANAGAGVSVTIIDAPLEEILAEQSAINVHLYSDASVYVACGTLPMAGGEVPEDGQDDQQDDQKDDDQQAGGGDDQQAEMATKTFELTLNGTVPEADAFYVAYAETDRVGSEASILVLCGEPGFEGTPGEAACEGDGTVYTETIEVPAGTELWFGFFRKEAADAEAERFHSGTETINADMTNTAWYDFGGDKGDDQQDDQQTGAADDQDDDQDDAQDDQQDEDMPDALPDTGAGAMAPPAFPVGNALAGASVLVAVAFAGRRRL